jgi:hypothetical protein
VLALFFAGWLGLVRLGEGCPKVRLSQDRLPINLHGKSAEIGTNTRR